MNDSLKVLTDLLLAGGAAVGVVIKAVLQSKSNGVVEEVICCRLHDGKNKVRRHDKTYYGAPSITQ